MRQAREERCHDYSGWSYHFRRRHDRKWSIPHAPKFARGSANNIWQAYWIDYGFYFLSGSVQWRFPVAFQSFFTIVVMVGLLFLPDSPRWLMMNDRNEEAHDVIARLLGHDLDHPNVLEEMSNIRESLYIQNRGGGFKYRELLTNGPSQNFRRTFLGALSQFCQQFCGINLVVSHS